MENKIKQNNKSRACLAKIEQCGACPAELKRSGGFTIIETMISISLFLIIVMAGMGALLNANLLHTKSQDMRSVMDSLSFVMEDMSKNIRTGYNYHCIDDFNTLDVYSPKSCGVNGGGIAFTSSSGPTFVYYIGQDTSVPPVGRIWKYTQDPSNPSPIVPFQLTPNEVNVESISSFSVLGAEPLSSGDKQQPFVTIRLVGQVTSKGIDSPFSLQTSVSQRLVDNQ